jgi:hypothetical protein
MRWLKIIQPQAKSIGLKNQKMQGRNGRKQKAASVATEIRGG